MKQLPKNDFNTGPVAQIVSTHWQNLCLTYGKDYMIQFVNEIVLNKATKPTKKRKVS